MTSVGRKRLFTILQNRLRCWLLRDSCPSYHGNAEKSQIVPGGFPAGGGNDHPVEQLVDTLSVLCDVGIVGHHDDGPAPVVKAGEERHDAVARARVEVSR